MKIFFSKTCAFVVGLLIAAQPGGAQSDIQTVEHGGRTFQLVTETELREETRLSVTRVFGYDESRFRDENLAVFLSSSSQCWLIDNMSSVARRSLYGYGPNDHFLFNSLEPSMAELAWAGYVLDGYTQFEEIRQSEQECLEGLTLGRAFSEFPVFLVLGELQQTQRTPTNFRAPYFVINSVFYSGEGVESFLVPGEAATFAFEAAVRILSRRAVRPPR